MNVLRFATCQAPAAGPFAAAVSRHVGKALGIKVEFVDRIPWQERLWQFDAGLLHVCWMCGLPYVWRADRSPDPPELLAAPVMAGPRYGAKPIYFSDVVVLRDSPWSSFASLRQSRWAYNEKTSHSGYNATRQRLARMKALTGFFREVVPAGSHEASLRLLLDGTVDAAAIDSTVLDLLYKADLSLVGRIRTVEVLGPSPMPPWVVSPTVPQTLRTALKRAFLAVSDDAVGRAALSLGLASRFVRVTDASYNPIRRMDREAQGVVL